MSGQDQNRSRTGAPLEYQATPSVHDTSKLQVAQSLKNSVKPTENGHGDQGPKGFENKVISIARVWNEVDILLAY